jgi:hypothetical protein
MVVDAPDEDSVKRLVDSAVKDFQLARRIQFSFEWSEAVILFLGIAEEVTTPAVFHAKYYLE